MTQSFFNCVTLKPLRAQFRIKKIKGEEVEFSSEINNFTDEDASIQIGSHFADGPLTRAQYSSKPNAPLMRVEDLEGGSGEGMELSFEKDSVSPP